MFEDKEQMHLETDVDEVNGKFELYHYGCDCDIQRDHLRAGLRIVKDY